MSDWAMTYCLTGGRVGDICDHPQRAAAQRADRNIDIKYTDWILLYKIRVHFGIKPYRRLDAVIWVHV